MNRGFLEMLMEKDYLPVIAPVGIGPGGETLHLSPEGAAAEVAIALGAPKLILLQDAKGLLAGGEVRNQLDRHRPRAPARRRRGASAEQAAGARHPPRARRRGASGSTSSTAGWPTPPSPSSSPTTASARW